MSELLIEEEKPDGYDHYKLTVDLMQTQKMLNADIVKLKNFVSRYKPNVLSYMKSQAGYQQWKKDFEYH